MKKNPEFRRMLLLGLGGAGQSIVLNLKRLFLDAYGVLPPSIKILSLDTDAAQAKLRSSVSDRTHALEPQEFMHLKVPEPRQFIESPQSIAGRWYVRPVPVGAIANGAGAIRQNGRLGLFFHIAEFLRRIDHLVTDLGDAQLRTRMENARSGLGSSTDFRLSEGEPEVFVCGSLAGGTGSGTFVDVGILLRARMPQALIHGFFLLDWPYRNKAFARRVSGNVYAALSEIDNLQSIMHGGKDFVPYTVRYADDVIEVRDPPYTLFHLIDGRNELGQNVDDVDQLCETIATGIFLSVSSMADPVNSVVDNLLNAISVQQPRLWMGRSARYSSLGVSSLYYPARELHRLLAAESALRLCRAAIAEVESGLAAAQSDKGAPSGTPQQSDLETFLERHSLGRLAIRDGMCPFRSDVTFVVEPFEVADPSLLKPKAEAAEAGLLTQLDTAAAGDGKVFLQAKLDALQRKIAALVADDAMTTAARRSWLLAAIERFTTWDDQAAREFNDAATRAADKGAAADAQLAVVLAAWYLPIVRGPRASAAARWGTLVEEWLRESLVRARLDHERRFHQAAIALLQAKVPPAVKASEVIEVLLEAERTLRGQLRAEHDSFGQVRNRATQVVVGNGDVVVLPQGKSIALAESQTVGYEEFKTEQDVRTPEWYLKVARERPGGLAGLLRVHCERKLVFLLDVGVYDALETLGAESGDAHDYMRSRIDDLFRLAAPMWSFHRSRLTELQSLRYDRIVNLGVHEQEAGRQCYEAHVSAVKAKYHLQSSHTFSTTGDPYRIWLLAYAAALPIYFLRDLERSKERYEEEITPTYHIDPDLEMNVPDLFPTDDVGNKVLRVLGMAIVEGIEVVKDKKLDHGHMFTCDIEAVRALNLKEPKIWGAPGTLKTGTAFREMYLEVIESCAENPEVNLLKLIEAALRERVEAMSEKQLRECIEEHVKRLGEKLARRDFSRLYSARLTYREIKELKDFLESRRYGMELDRYLEGRLKA